MSIRSIFAALFIALSLIVFSCMAAQAQFFQQGSKLVGTGIIGNSEQGKSVSISADGNTVLVGGYADDNATGAVWVFTRNNGAWHPQGAKLIGTGGVGAPRQGVSVSVSADGNTAIVGGYTDYGGVGAAWIFSRTGSTWTQQGSKLLGSGFAGNGWQGVSVAMSGDGSTALVGAQHDNNDTGAVWVYTRSGNSWIQQGDKLVGSGATGPAQQGQTVNLSYDGNTAIIGGCFDDGLVGAVWIYTRSGGVWTQEGSKLVGTGHVGGSAQGGSVALSSDGNTAMVGGHYDNNYAGAAWVYTRSAGVWTQQGGKITGANVSGLTWFGRWVSLSGDGTTAVIGGPYDDASQGGFWVFGLHSGTWSQQGAKNKGTGNAGAAFQGDAVGISRDGKTVVVGGEYDNYHAGAAWIFQSDSTLGIDVQPSNVAFGKTLVGDTTLREITISNSDFNDTLAVTSITSTNPSFSAALGSAEILPGHELTVRLLYGPTSVHQDTSTLLIASTDPLQPIVGIPMTGEGYSPAPEPIITSLRDIPKDQGRQLRVIWSRSVYDGVIDTVKALDYNVWRRVGQNEISPKAARMLTEGVLSIGGRRMAFHDGELWDYIESIPAVTFKSYAYVSPTLFDSTADAGIQWSVFMVSVHLNSGTYLFSGSDSGYSVDNLDPLPPANAALHVGVGVVALGWDPPPDDDVTHYNIYSSTVHNFSPGASSRFGTSSTNSFVDARGPSSAPMYYRISAIDKSGNESPYSSELTTSLTGLANDREFPKSFALYQSYPNPFNPSTTIRFDVPKEARIRIRIYDVRGAEIETISDERRPAGSYTLSWNAQSAPTGIYFARMDAEDFHATVKMLLVK